MIPLAALALLAAAAPPARVQPAVTAVEQTSGTTALLIAVSPVSERVAWVSGARGTYARTTDGGATWEAGQVPGAEALQFRDVHALDGNTAWLLSIGNADSSRIYHTTDGGKHWALQFTNPEPRAFYDCFDFWDRRRGLAVSDAVEGRLVLAATADGGRTWTPVPASVLPPALPGEGGYASSGTCLVTRPGGLALIALGTPISRLLHTADFGRSWRVDTVPIARIASVSARDDRRWIVFGWDSTAATALTRNGGRSWERGAKPPFPQGVYGGAYVPGPRSATVVAAGPGGLAWSPDEGATWTLISDQAYWGVGFASANAGWAVGPGGRITKLAGF
jgi:photosystem II stability/assembly factor-like uncharacterized protein